MTETAPISSHNGPPVESPLSDTTGATAGGREPARVLLLAHSLRSGGTEAQIVALAKGLDRRRFRLRGGDDGLDRGRLGRRRCRLGRGDVRGLRGHRLGG